MTVSSHWASSSTSSAPPYSVARSVSRPTTAWSKRSVSAAAAVAIGPSSVAALGVRLEEAREGGGQPCDQVGVRSGSADEPFLGGLPAVGGEQFDIREVRGKGLPDRGQGGRVVDDTVPVQDQGAGGLGAGCELGGQGALADSRRT